MKALDAIAEIVRRHVPEPDRADALLLVEVVRRRLGPEPRRDLEEDIGRLLERRIP